MQRITVCLRCDPALWVAGLTEKVKTLKAALEKRKEQQSRIRDFMKPVERYSDIRELTPELIRSFVDRIIVHEKRKENGHYRQEVEIVYNFIWARLYQNSLSELRLIPRNFIYKGSSL